MSTADRSNRFRWLDLDLERLVGAINEARE